MRITILHFIKLFIFSVSSLSLLACGGGGGGGNPTTGSKTPTSNNGNTGITVTNSSLKGNWSGASINKLKKLNAMSLSIAADPVNTGKLVITGINKTGKIRSITRQAGQFFTTSIPVSTSVSSSADQILGFYVDSTANYMVIITENQDYALLQKSALAYDTNFVENDIDTINAQRWIGLTFGTDLVNNLNSFFSNATCNSVVTTTKCRAVSGTLSSDVIFTPINRITNENKFFHRSGTYKASTGEIGIIDLFLSPDRKFGTTFSCDIPGTFPASCEFSAWLKK